MRKLIVIIQKKKMEKKYSFYFLDKYFLKILLTLYKHNKLFGKNQIFFKKNYFFFKKIKNNNLFIFKGNKFRSLNVLYFHFGYRFGNFTFTKKPFKYLIKTKINSKLIKR